MVRHLADPEGALAGLDLAGIPERRRQLDDRLLPPHGEDHRLAGLVPEVLQDRARPEGAERTPVHPLDDVADPDAGGGRGGSGLDVRDMDADGRVAGQGDPGEDREREEDVHDDAGDEDDELHRQARRRERPRVVRSVAVLTLELHEAADRQPVQRVDGVADIADDLRARRKADAELEDADPEETRDHEVAELMDDHEDPEDPEEEDDRDERPDDLVHAKAAVS